jgi:dTMP kinase
MKLDKKIIQINNKYLLKKIKINFTFLLIVSEKNLKLRLSKRKMLNRYDKFNFSFYKRVQNGFINQSKKNKRKYLLINSNNKINKNKKLIILKLRKLLNI